LRAVRFPIPLRPHPSDQYRRAIESGQWPRQDLFPDPAFPFALIDNQGHPELPLHSHEGFCELVIIYGGHGTHFTAESKYPVGEGDVFVIAGEMAHGYKDVEDLCLLNVVFDPLHFLAKLPDIKKLPGYHALFSLEPKYREQHRFESRLRLSPNELAHVVSLITELARYTTDRPRGYEFIARALFMELVWFLCDCYVKGGHPSSHSLILMGQVISFIESNYAEDLCLDRLAKVARMSVRNLLLLFREATGLSPIDYLIRLRIARSCEFLHQTSAPVTDVAFQVGFQDSNYFARQFRRVMGMPPSEYRERAVLRH